MTPEYIMGTWTNELFDLMVEKLTERKQSNKDAMEGRRRVSVDALALASGGKIKHKKKGA